MQSVYKKDFTWPTFLTTKTSDQAESLELEAARESNKEKDSCAKERQRERLPLHPSKSPTDQEGAFEEAPEYLIKAFKKFPHLHIIYQEAGEEQLMKKIQDGLFKTSYQIDYGKEGFIPKDDYDELMEIAEALRAKRQRVCKAEVHGEEGDRAANNCIVEAEPCTCDKGPNIAKLAKRPVSITKGPRIPREGKKTQEADKENFKGKGASPDLVKPRSEYKDTIERLGEIIIKHKLYHKKPEM